MNRGEALRPRKRVQTVRATCPVPTLFAVINLGYLPVEVKLLYFCVSHTAGGRIAVHPRQLC